jgi:hypothetical protein
VNAPNRTPGAKPRCGRIQDTVTGFLNARLLAAVGRDVADATRTRLK